MIITIPFGYTAISSSKHDLKFYELCPLFKIKVIHWIGQDNFGRVEGQTVSEILVEYNALNTNANCGRTINIYSPFSHILPYLPSSHPWVQLPVT